MARHVCTIGAGLACKAEQALAPTAASLRSAAVQYAGLLRQGNIRGAGRLAAGHAACAAGRWRPVLRWATDAAASAWAFASSFASTYAPHRGALPATRNRAATSPDFRASARALRERASKLRQRAAAAARSSYAALNPDRKLAGLAAGSQRLPPATCLMLAAGAGLLGTAAALTAHIVWG